jgi:hypothetical protein
VASDKPQADSFNPHNLLVAVVGCILISSLASITVYLTSDLILQSLRSTDAMVVLITDKGIVSDDVNLEKNLNSATAALMACRDIALGLAISCGLIFTALVLKWSGLSKHISRG